LKIYLPLSTWCCSQTSIIDFWSTWCWVNLATFSCWNSWFYLFARLLVKLLSFFVNYISHIFCRNLRELTFLWRRSFSWSMFWCLANFRFIVKFNRFKTFLFSFNLIFNHLYLLLFLLFRSILILDFELRSSRRIHFWKWLQLLITFHWHLTFWRYLIKCRIRYSTKMTWHCSKEIICWILYLFIFDLFLL